MSAEKQKTVEIEGVVLTQKAIDALEYFQGGTYHDNGGIKGMNETLSDAIDVILETIEGEESEKETEMTTIHSIKNLKSLLSDLGVPRNQRADDSANKEVAAIGATEESGNTINGNLCVKFTDSFGKEHSPMFSSEKEAKDFKSFSDRIAKAKLTGSAIDVMRDLHNEDNGRINSLSDESKEIIELLLDLRKDIRDSIGADGILRIIVHLRDMQWLFTNLSTNEQRFIY